MTATLPRPEVDPAFTASGATDAELLAQVAAEVSARDQAIAAEASARTAGIASAFDAASNEQGTGTMLKGFVEAGKFWRIRTEQEAGWSAAANVTRLDAAGWFKTSFTAAKTTFSTPTLDTWFQNTSGSVVYFCFTIGIVELGGQNEHVYLEEATTISPSITGLTRVDFIALRTGTATS